MSTDRWAEDYGLTPEEAAAIASDDALLDALGSRSMSRDDALNDPAARMLASWVAELDQGTADDARATNVKLAKAPIAPKREPVPATVSSLDARRAKALLAASVVVTGLLVPAGVAAATGYSPVAPYRAAVSTVFGTAPAPAVDARTTLDEVKAALDRGDTAEATRLLTDLKSTLEIGDDPELDGMINDIEDQIDLAKANNGKANGPSNAPIGGNGNAAIGSNGASDGKAQNTVKNPGTTTGTGKPAGGGKPSEAPGRAKSSPVASTPPVPSSATPPATGPSASAPGKSGTAGGDSGGNGKNKN
jgi:hypothetical protein